MIDNLREELKAKIKLLNEATWEHRAREPLVDRWLENFCFSERDVDRDQLHALHLLSQFMYFGNRELRSLLRTLYRDLFRYPIVQRLRADNANITNVSQLNALFRQELCRTRFLGMGNPSESGVHLLYYFRQEAGLPKDVFIHTHQIFARAPSSASTGTNPTRLILRDPNIQHFVFLDDLCGSGKQAQEYSQDLLEEIRALGAQATLHYYVLFATSEGLQAVRDHTRFDRCECVFELDSSYKVFDGDRYFEPEVRGIDKAYSRNMCEVYGKDLEPNAPLGFCDGQLLMSFHHNTPDNTLPIIWSDAVTSRGKRWESVFRRYWKYLWSK